MYPSHIVDAPGGHSGQSAACTHKPGTLHPDLAEQRRNPVTPPIFHVASAAAWLTVRPKNRVVPGLRSDGLLLNSHQPMLCLGQRQPSLAGSVAQVCDVTETIRPTDLHHVETSRLTVHLRPGQTQRLFHPRAPSRQHSRPVVSF
jgi:hypothetical protein